jgi:hypothetical protein
MMGQRWLDMWDEGRKIDTKFWEWNLEKEDHIENQSVYGSKILQEFLGRTNRLLSFDMTRTAQKT